MINMVQLGMKYINCHLVKAPVDTVYNISLFTTEFVLISIAVNILYSG